jgi:membrane protease subunit HflK
VDRVQVRTVRQLDVGFFPEATEDAPVTPPGQLLTGDQNLVNVKLVVEYAIDDRDGELEDYVAQRDQVDAVLSRETEALAGEWVGGRPVDEVLLTGRAVLPQWVMDRLPDRLAPHRLGVVVQRVSVDLLAPPDRVGEVSVRDAFEQVNQAQTAIATQENQARQDAARRLREAEATRFRLEQQAAAYRSEKLALAKADAESFLKRLDQYRRLRQSNPDILAAIWWDEMGRTLVGLKNRGRVDLLDHHLGPDGLDVTTFLPPKRK